VEAESVPTACRDKLANGPQSCVADCPGSAPCGVFRYARVEKPGDVPAADPLAIDVAILDMNHGWPNLGHDSLVHAVLDAACDLVDGLDGTGLYVRAISYDVRRSGMIPEGPGGRFALYVGTGGPAHIDPWRNDGVADWSQGIREDASWETPFFALLDAIRDDEDAALLAVCHTFGVMCRWSGVAEPRLRGPEKGGKSTGVLENVLAPDARRHPWFSLFARELPDGRRLRILDNRLFDLVPGEAPPPPGFLAIGFETERVGGPAGEAITMMELARDAGGVMPRIFATNHHPEILDRERQRAILQQKRGRGEVSEAWVREREEILTRSYPGEDVERRLRLTSEFTLLGPLRFHLHRALRRRAERLGLRVDVHEDRVIEQAGRVAAAV
jgi:hypothetical protein